MCCLACSGLRRVRLGFAGLALVGMQTFYHLRWRIDRSANSAIVKHENREGPMLTQIAQWWTGPDSEEDAMRRVLEGGVLARTSLAIRAGLALALDPDDTRQVFYLAFAVDHATLQRLVAHFASD